MCSITDQRDALLNVIFCVLRAQRESTFRAGHGQLSQYPIRGLGQHTAKFIV